MIEVKLIPIADLLVNTENYRFESVASQKEAIDKMIYNQGMKLLTLAEHILQHGLNPFDPIQVNVSNHDSSKYNVLEGNRRTVTLKILHNPDLIDSDHADLKKKIKKLRDENSSRLITEVSCAVFDNPKEADVWIGLKHGYGASGAQTDGWDPLQKDRYKERTEGKTSVTIQFINLMKNSADVPESIKKNIEKIDATNATRLFGDPDVRSFLGIETSNGVIQSTVEEKEVIKGLVQVAKDLLDPKFTVKRIYNKDDRKDYIASFPKTKIPNTSKKASKPWQFDGGEPTPAPAPKKKATPAKKPIPNPKERNKLIPRACKITISNAKVNAIYHELQDLDLKYTNAAAVLFRVFVELSVDTYLEEHKLVATTSATEANIGLKSKIDKVANHLSANKLADAALCRGIKTAAGNKDHSILAVDTWHAYVHNNKFSPSSESLITTWDNIQEFMVTLWGNIK
ncbi:hypothetical protein H7F15_06195 [Pontibacter sp. Tf4]|uniref:hypothetical protein n=1 Tax=Pontibacter sp. Tf4 TaxID=2761620 RepID=UPI00162979E7|nr:hypothetical protein [Pontibacter sp. Tf4]MBB6610619.1 hypothetical protein [Pontibacter sp. Tf4]